MHRKRNLFIVIEQLMEAKVAVYTLLLLIWITKQKTSENPKPKKICRDVNHTNKTEQAKNIFEKLHKSFSS